MAVETVGFADFVDFAVPADLVDLMIVEPVEPLDSLGSLPDQFESLEEFDEAVGQLAGYFAEFFNQRAGFAVEIENQIAESVASFDFENLVALDLGRFVVEMILIGLHFGLIAQAAAEDLQVPGQAQRP